MRTDESDESEDRRPSLGIHPGERLREEAVLRGCERHPTLQKNPAVEDAED